MLTSRARTLNYFWTEISASSVLLTTSRMIITLNEKWKTYQQNTNTTMRTIPMSKYFIKVRHTSFFLFSHRRISICSLRARNMNIEKNPTPMTTSSNGGVQLRTDIYFVVKLLYNQFFHNIIFDIFLCRRPSLIAFNATLAALTNN